MAAQPNAVDHAIEQYMQTRYISAMDLDGKCWPVEIERVVDDGDAAERLKGKEHIVTFFKGRKKGMHHCKATLRCLIKMFKKKSAGWIGKKIFIYPDTFNGKDCVRIWGSPDIAEEVSIETCYKGGGRKIFRMHKTMDGYTQPTPAARVSEPPPADAPDLTPPDGDEDLGAEK